MQHHDVLPCSQDLAITHHEIHQSELWIQTTWHHTFLETSSMIFVGFPDLTQSECGSLAPQSPPNPSKPNPVGGSNPFWNIRKPAQKYLILSFQIISRIHLGPWFPSPKTSLCFSGHQFVGMGAVSPQSTDGGSDDWRVKWCTGFSGYLTLK